LKQLSLISLNDYQALVVVITEDGQVLNRHLEFSDPCTSTRLSQVQNVLNRGFVGKTLAEIQQEQDSELLDALQEPLVRLVLEAVLSCLKEGRQARSHRLGVSSLLKKPEFSQANALLPIMQVLEDEAVLLHIMEDDLKGAGDTVVRIGHENNSQDLSGVSVVASPYGRGDHGGVIAVIGPTRMDYSKVIKAVSAAKQVLQGV
ncbi:MAG: hypothetical protein LBG81_07995, partial [Coriobacteriaceae bacterium]|nr:hypothetical protein [Coriobacteriaceae bacterium]